MKQNQTKKHNITLNTKSIKSFINKLLLIFTLSLSTLSIYYFPYDPEPIYSDMSDGHLHISINSQMFQNQYYQILDDRIVIWNHDYVTSIGKSGKLLHDYSDKSKYSIFEFNSSQYALMKDEILIDNIGYLNNSISPTENIEVMDSISTNVNTELSNEFQRLLDSAAANQTEEESRRAKEEWDERNRIIDQKENFKIKTLERILDSKTEGIDYNYNEDKTIVLKIQKSGSFKVFINLVFPLIFSLKIKTLLLVFVIFSVLLYAFIYLKKNVKVTLK